MTAERNEKEVSLDRFVRDLGGNFSHLLEKSGHYVELMFNPKERINTHCTHRLVRKRGDGGCSTGRK